MGERYPKPDPSNTDAFEGPAGEGWSSDGDAWYHEDLLMPEAEDEAHALAQTRARMKAAENDPASPNFRCHVLAEDVEGDRYLIDVGFGYTRILDTEHHRLYPPMRGQEMKFNWASFAGDEAEILQQAREATRLDRDAASVVDADSDLLNSRP